MRLPQLLLIASVVLTACVGKQPQASIQPQSRPTVLGVAELAMGVPSSSAQVGFRAMSASLEPIDGITFTWKSTYNVKDAAGNRYLTTTFAVHNSRSTELRNFTVIALARAGGIDGTAITRVTSFAGNDASQRAREVMPAAAMTTAGVVDTLNTGLQVLLPDESAALQAAALSAQPKPAIGTNDVVLDYGFVVKNAAGQHVVAPGQDGSLTFSFRVPATDAKGDPYSFTMSFLLTTTSTTRVTETLEEQTSPDLIASRRATASAGETLVLAGTRLADESLESVCKPRVAVGLETTYLADGSETPLFDSFAITNSARTPVGNTDSVPLDARVAVHFERALFSQRPTQEGGLVLHGSLSGVRKGSTVAPSSLHITSSSFLPGEVVQAGIQPREYDLCDSSKVVATAGARTLTYRVAVPRLDGGSSAFGAFKNIQQSGLAKALAVGDANRDARPDIFFIKANVLTDRIQVFRPDRSGSNYEVLPVPGVASVVDPVGIALSDFDSSGSLDLLLTDKSDSSSGVVRLFSNDGLGSFSERPAVEIGQPLGVIRSADLSGDGFQDAVALSPSTGKLFVLTNNRAGGFSKQVVDSGTGQVVNHLVLIDADRQDGIDMIVAPVNGKSPILLKNDGRGSFYQGQPLISAATTETIVALSALDLNSDGAPEIVAGLSKGRLAIWSSDGAHTLVAPTVPVDSVMDLVVGNWDSDDDVDLAMSVIYVNAFNNKARAVMAIKNDHPGTLKYEALMPFVTGTATHFLIAAADFDNDFDLDLATSSSSAVGFLPGIK